MRAKSVGLYARVSSDQQVQEATVLSQIEALKQRATADGQVIVPSDVFVDDGYSGATLVRPALERLRDRVAEGGLDVLYVHSADRLARRYAYQVLLLEELGRYGVTVIFLNGPSGRSAEDELLVQVQGMIAEYERAKILERCRRGKLHKARLGLVNVMSKAPYGYLYVRRTDGDPASYQVVPHEAKIVQSVFQWFVRDQVSLGEVVRRLRRAQVPSPSGRSQWGRPTVWGLLRNPAYAGEAAYGKTETVVRSPVLRPQRGRPQVPRRAKSSSRDKPSEQWIRVAVPAIVSTEIFAGAQEQLERNRKFVTRERGNRYLLQGLTVCKQCGYAYYGKRCPKDTRYGYYRCRGCDGFRFGGTPVCDNSYVRVEQLDDYVWSSVRKVVQDPARVVAEWSRRGQQDGSVAELQSHRDEAQRLLSHHEMTLRRLVDAYEAGALDMKELTVRTDRVRARIRNTQAELQEAESVLQHTADLTAIVGKLEDFTNQVKTGLHKLDWQRRRQIIRTLVSRIEIDKEAVTIVYRIPQTTADPEHGPSREPTGPVFSPVFRSSGYGRGGPPRGMTPARAGDSLLTEIARLQAALAPVE
jgi:site-specific DNA recombinase